ncbi:MAG: tandem-95 repeat protein [Deltaproteobacteria bacterium]|nr:tandem-95 repeat protein [Deltaproteobacteria bacterium]MBT7889476.1 tandem-95 repeat protein [Deltaproteobacteria bacterium]
MQRNRYFWGILLFNLTSGLVLYFAGALSHTLQDRHISLNEDSFIEIDLSAGGSTTENVTYEVDILPESGWLEGKLPRIVYHPKANYFGQDRIEYSEVTKGETRQSAVIHVTIQGLNDPPQISDTQIKLLEDNLGSLTLKATDSDNEALTYAILKQPLHGKLSGKNPNFIYTPESGYFGEDRLVFIASDAESHSKPGTIRIIVTPLNKPPIANSVSLLTYQNLPLVIDFDGIDQDNDKLLYEWITKPEFGSLKKERGRTVYHPQRRFIGQDSFSYRASDGVHHSKPAIVNIEVQSFEGSDKLSEILGRVVDKGGIALGKGASENFVFQKGLYVPASILKLVTALAAIHYLGEEARFQTEFFLDQDRNLYIKGYADPSMSTAEWRMIATELAKIGIFDKPLRSLVLDDTAIEKDIDFDGRGKTLNYFDAPLGALPTNYNTIAVNIKSKHGILPWKNQTPVTEMVRKRARGLPNGFQRFTVATNPEKGTRYTGELVQEIFRQFGLKNKPPVKLGTVPFSLDAFYIHNSSSDMEDVITTMLYESSNFIANQLLLVMAIDKYGEQAKLSQGVILLKRFLKKQLGLKSMDFEIVEGSGLSRKNRVGLKAMLDVVNSFGDHRNLLPNLTKSKYSDLAKIGKRWHIRAKTGTMRGLATLAGFLQKKDKQWLPFVIMLEGRPADRATVLEIICRYYAG